MGGAAFRYPVAPGVKGVIHFDAQALHYKQGLRRTAIPLAAIRQFAVRQRSKSLGMVASELLVRVESAPNRFKVQSIPFDPTAHEAQRALAALRERVPAEADLTSLPWEQAADALGVKASGLSDRLLNTRVSLGIAVLCASVVGGAITRELFPPASGAERFGHGAGVLLGVAVGVVLMITGWRKR